MEPHESVGDQACEGGAGRVLIVEDGPTLPNLASLILARGGFEVDLVYSVRRSAGADKA